MRSTTRTVHTARTRRVSHRAAALRVARRDCAPLVTAVPLRVQGAPAQRGVGGGTHLTRRGRVVALLVLVTLLFAAFSFGRAGSQAATSPEPAAAVVQTTVQPGESLWTLARRVAPQSDPRAVVAQLRELNDLSGSGLQAGQLLLLPA